MNTLTSEVSYEFLRQKSVERVLQTEQGSSDREPLVFLLPGEEPEIRRGSFAEQAQIFLESLTARRTPAKPATISTWQSLIDVHILPKIGQESLASFDNGAMEKFVDALCDAELRPRQVLDCVLAVKLILKSAVDGNGNFLRPRVWNNAFLDLPRVKGSNARAATQEIIEGAMKSCPKYALFSDWVRPPGCGSVRCLRSESATMEKTLVGLKRIR